MIFIVSSLRCRRTDISDVGESNLDIGEQTVGKTTVIPDSHVHIKTHSIFLASNNIFKKITQF